MRRLAAREGIRGPLVFVAAAAIVLALPYWGPLGSDFRVTQLQYAAALVVIVLGLNLLTGLSGQISLGHSGFALVGAYVLAMLLEEGVLGEGVHLLLALVAATVAAAAVGLVIGVPALRLSGPHLAIATLGFGLVVPVVLRWDGLADLTGGSQGLLIAQPEPPGPLARLFGTSQWRYALIAVPALAAGVVAWNLTRSRLGRGLVALRENELAAAQLGIDVARYKLTAFAISAGYAGLGGALFSYASIGVVSPDAYGLVDNVHFLAAIVVGGIGSIAGSVLGAIFIAYHTEVVDYLLGDSWAVSVAGIELLAVESPLRALERPESLRPAATATILILTILFAPRGLAGLIAAAARRLRRALNRAGSAGAASR